MRRTVTRARRNSAIGQCSGDRICNYCAFNPKQIVPSEDGGIDPAMEAALSVAMEPDTDFTPYESRVAETLDSSPVTDSGPPASVPIEFDWTPIMEFTSVDIFQHSPFRDVIIH